MRESRRRLLFFAAALTLCFIALELRLFHLQVIQSPGVEEAVAGMHRQAETELAGRGRIMVGDEYVLAESISAVEIYANSSWTEQHREQITRELEETLGVSGGEVRALLERGGYRKILRQPLRDALKVDALWRKKREKKLPGLELERTWVRSYPEGRLAANVVGYADGAGHGHAGVELFCDDVLKGTAGRQVLERDAALRPMFDVDCRFEPPAPGCDVYLTLDMVLQYYAEEALDQLMEEHRPEWATAIVLDPRTGDVLALAVRPTFDPAHYGNYDLSAHVNRAVSFHYTPGSTFKPFMMAAAIERNLVQFSEIIDCTTFQLGRRSVRDSHQNGLLTPREVMIKSSNIGMAKLALRLAPDEAVSPERQLDGFRGVHTTLTNLGFGCRTGVGLPAETSGMLASPANWSRAYTLVSLGFGHEIAVSPLQLASAYTVFTNDGMYRPPRIVARIVAPDGTVQVQERPAARRVFSEATAEAVREMLIGVVDEGTGKSAAIQCRSVAGKTSTAQWEEDPSKYTSSFVGFAPAHEPRLLVAIVVDQPRGALHSGGMVAAPAARDILERGLAYLRVELDRTY
ncbi:MAG: penicillin-binding protein 2 [Planctomycetes bacterium]|nr:penicillin-binding protein 2 [Planctomycetota bacterium]